MNYLNLTPGSAPLVVKVSEGDIGREISFTLVEDGLEYTIPTGSTITCEILKSDGHGTTIPCTWSGSEVMMVTTEQSTIRAGKANCELRIVSDSYNIGTANFILAVEPRPINADTDQTDSSYSQTGDPGDVWTLGSNGVPSWAKGGIDATTATAGQAPIADGAGGWAWGDVATSGDSVPSNVRQAIFNRLNHALYSDADAPTDLSVIEAWADTTTTAIRLNPTSLTFTGEESKKITATLIPADSTDVVAWSSSNPKVATVSASGVVTSVGNGTCTIFAKVGNVVASCPVTVSGIIVYYTITNNLTNITNSNADTVILGGDSYSGTLTPGVASSITSVIVTMDGVDITASAYNASDATVTIPEVTGHVVITGIAESALLYTLPEPATFDGTASIATGVDLFKGLGDVDWTITGTFVDSWTDDVNVGKTLFGYYNTNNLKCNNNTGNQLAFLAGTAAHACQGTVSKGTTNIVRKVVLRRAKGELSIKFDSKVNNVTEQKVATPASNKTLSDYLATPLPIYIGGLNSSSHDYIGTCNEFSIYKAYLSDADVARYME